MNYENRNCNRRRQCSTVEIRLSIQKNSYCVIGRITFQMDESKMLRIKYDSQCIIYYKQKALYLHRLFLYTLDSRTLLQSFTYKIVQLDFNKLEEISTYSCIIQLLYVIIEKNRKEVANYKSWKRSIKRADTNTGEKFRYSRKE